MADSNLLLYQAIHAALHAGDEIMRVYNVAPEIELKEDKSPLTSADRKSHQKISEMLKITGLPILSEEGNSISYEERHKWEKYWLVDPLDGTKEFIRHNGEFTVNIALIEKTRPVVGVIYIPVTGTLYFGTTWLPSMVKYRTREFLRESGSENAFNENLLNTSIRLPYFTAPRNYTVVASRSHMSPETEKFITGLRKKHGKLDYVSSGSSIKICMVADGTADCYPRLAPTMEWDTAAGQAIAENAGCKFINFHTGHPVSYNKENLLNPHFVVQRS
jgi:3'(2'), 5'-bisphosphate nucleotidase